jgi:hypothetical protein
MASRSDEALAAARAPALVDALPGAPAAEVLPTEAPAGGVPLGAVGGVATAPAEGDAAAGPRRNGRVEGDAVAAPPFGGVGGGLLADEGFPEVELAGGVCANATTGAPPPRKNSHASKGRALGAREDIRIADSLLEHVHAGPKRQLRRCNGPRAADARHAGRGRP